MRSRQGDRVIKFSNREAGMFRGLGGVGNQLCIFWSLGSRMAIKYDLLLPAGSRVSLPLERLVIVGYTDRGASSLPGSSSCRRFP